MNYLESEYELYKNIYYNELERKEKINLKLQYILSLWLLLVGALLFLINNYNKITYKFESIFNAGVILMVIFIVISGVYLGRCLIGVKYGYLQTPSQIKKYEKDLIDTYEDFTGMANKKFEEFLIETYILTSNNNVLANEKKSKFLIRSTLGLMLASIALIACFVVLLPGLLNNEEPVQKIEITNDNLLDGTYYLILKE